MKPAREIPFEVLSREKSSETDPWVALIARLMDSAFQIPGTNLRFGLDPIIGLIPGFGDAASALLSTLLVLQSARHGLPKIVLIRMVLNVLINAGIGAIPILGDLFSVYFRSNVKNYELLTQFSGQGKRSTRPDWIFVSALVGGLVLGLLVILLGLFSLLGLIFHAIQVSIG